MRRSQRSSKVERLDPGKATGRPRGCGFESRRCNSHGDSRGMARCTKPQPVSGRDLDCRASLTAHPQRQTQGPLA